MYHCLWKFLLVAVSLTLLGFFLQEENEEHLKYSLSLEEKKILWQLDQEQISSEVKNHLETFKDMQKTSSLLQQAKYKFLAGVPPQQKKLLVAGISSARHPHGSYLLDTLQSLFQASSEAELNCIVVLVCLSDSDPEWLNQTVTNISDGFKAHVEARRLLVVQGHISGSPLLGGLNNSNHSPPCKTPYSRQKADYALLMNFAISVSRHSLMLEDNVHCTPKFISTIYLTLLAWKERPWVILEFSILSLSGKVFHTSDLSRLTFLLLLFHGDTPTHLLLSEFRLLLAQNIPIRFSNSVFHHVSNYSVLEDVCFPVEGRDLQ